MRQGDRVVGYLPNSSLAVEAMLAAVIIGAVWSSTSPDTVSWLSLIQYQYCVLLLSGPSNTDVAVYNPNCLVSCTRTVCDRSTSSMSMVSRYTHANSLPTHPHTLTHYRGCWTNSLRSILGRSSLCLLDLENVVLFSFCGTLNIDTTSIPNWCVCVCACVHVCAHTCMHNVVSLSQGVKINYPKLYFFPLRGRNFMTGGVYNFSP